MRKKAFRNYKMIFDPSTRSRDTSVREEWIPPTAYLAADCQHSAVVSRRSSSTAFCRLEDLCRQANLQQLWRPMFRRCRPERLSFSLKLWNRPLCMHQRSYSLAL